ncbi:Os01g0586450, partial [Oryza sativa Japonica Group]
LIAPAGGDVVDGVAAAAEEEERQVEAADEADALGVAARGQVQLAEPVAGEGVGAALQHDGLRLEHLHHPRHDRLEQPVVLLVADAHAHRHVQRAVAAGALLADVGDGAGAREEAAAVLVERHRHHPVRRLEGGLDAVAVVDVDVHVEHAAEVGEQLADGEHDVVHVAEAPRAAAARVVHPARPVDGDVGGAAPEGARRGERPAGVAEAVIPEAVEHRVVDAAAAALALDGVDAPGARHVADPVVASAAVRGEVLEEGEVALVVEVGELRRRGGRRAEAAHVAEHAVGGDEVVRHGDAVRHHDVALAVVDGGDPRVVVVAHPPLLVVAARRRRQRIAAAAG